jgi:hypothetical protein
VRTVAAPPNLAPTSTLEPKQIPGYYYKKEINRYFKIPRPGEPNADYKEWLVQVEQNFVDSHFQQEQERKQSKEKPEDSKPAKEFRPSVTSLLNDREKGQARGKWKTWTKPNSLIHPSQVGKQKAFAQNATHFRVGNGVFGVCRYPVGSHLW